MFREPVLTSLIFRPAPTFLTAGIVLPFTFMNPTSVKTHGGPAIHVRMLDRSSNRPSSLAYWQEGTSGVRRPTCSELTGIFVLTAASPGVKPVSVRDGCVYWSKYRQLEPDPSPLASNSEYRIP
jgi:hypothetical protein